MPVAARYTRQGIHYRADLITRRIEGATTLAELVAIGSCNADVAARVGTTVAEFHAAGACHADLNAHNVLLVGESVWLVDFDRGQRRTPARAWQLANLARLRRSDGVGVVTAAERAVSADEEMADSRFNTI